MKQKRKKALDGIAVACWGVGVIMVAVFLGMTAAYARCDGTICDIYTPSCGTTVYYKPAGFATEGCFKLIGGNSGNPEQGLCKGSGEQCSSCLCRPAQIKVGQLCECR